MKKKKMSTDQVSLYHMVQRQVKRELRKVRKEFLTSAARRDIMQISETSLQAMKQELIVFMAEHPPGNVTVRSSSLLFCVPSSGSAHRMYIDIGIYGVQIKVSNPENARIRAAIETYDQQLKR